MGRSILLLPSAQRSLCIDILKFFHHLKSLSPYLAEYPTKILIFKKIKNECLISIWLMGAFEAVSELDCVHQLVDLSMCPTNVTVCDAYCPSISE